MADRVLYTIGTSQRTADEFIRLLKSCDIQQVFDVRRFPRSRFSHFKGEALALMLKEAGIEYCWLGAALGGFRRGGYEVYMKSQEFQQGLRALVQQARERRSAILCAEKLPSRCHRRFIAQELERLGFKIGHII